MDTPFDFNVFPPSPEAAALAKFADIPVSLYTGVPKISIPLLKITERDLLLPVTLDYHTSGHKVEDQATRLGLGWSLNAGGIVTRVIRGLPDEYAPGGFLNQASGQTTSASSYFNADVDDKSHWYDAMVRGCRNAEPDTYFFRFGPYAGKFQFNWKGEIVHSSNQNLRISPIGLNTNDDKFIQGWDITTPDGLRWTFDTRESTSSILSATELLTDPCRSIMNTNQPPHTWHLSEVASSSSNSHIRFFYEPYSTKTERWSMETIIHPSTVPERQKITSLTNGMQLSKITTSSNEVSIEFVTGLLEEATEESPQLRTLDKIIVNSQQSPIRTWLFEYDKSLGRLTLRSVKEVGEFEGIPPFRFNYYKGVLPKSLSFRQDHWGFPNNNPKQMMTPGQTLDTANGVVSLPGADRSPAPENARIGMLREIIYPTGGKDIFEFEPHDYSFEQDKQLSKAVSVQASVSGFAPDSQTKPNETFVDRKPFTLPENPSGSEPKGQEAVLSVTFTIGTVFATGLFAPKIAIVNKEGKEVFSLVGSGTVDSDGEPSKIQHTLVFNPNSTPPKPATLPPRELPPGQYDFVCTCKVPPKNLGINSVAASMQWEVPTGESTTPIVQGGGVRIKRHLRSFGFQIPDYIRNFQYEMDVAGERVSSGSLHESALIYSIQMTFLKPVGLGTTIPLSESVQKLVRFSQNRSALGTTSGSHVGYKKVIVTEGDLEKSSNGRTEYEFSSAIDFPDTIVDQLPFPPARIVDFKRGLLTKKTEYDAENAIIRRIESQYHFFEKTNEGVKVAWKVPFLGGTLGETGPTGPGFIDRYAVIRYENVIGYSRLKSQTESTFGSNNENTPFVVTTRYEFDETGHKQLTSEETDLEDSVLRTEHKYPSDYKVGANQAIDALVDQHRINIPIESATFIKGSNLITAERRPFELVDQKPRQVAREVAAIEENHPADGDIFESLSELYETRQRILAYDFHGNMLEQTGPGGLTTSFLWSSNSTQLIAEIRNASQRQVYFQNFEDQNLTDTTNEFSFSGSRSKFVAGKFSIQPDLLPAIDGDYVLTYWRKQGASPWERIQKFILNYTAGSPIETDPVEGHIDEVRLTPTSAAMTSFCYLPFIGIQSRTDENDFPVFYAYDSLGRIQTTRDHTGSIRSHVQYGFLDPNDAKTHNFVRTYTPNSADVVTLSEVLASSKAKVQISTTFLDLLGREIQTVERQATPAGNDFVSLTSYDSFGRNAVAFLPFASQTMDGSFKVIDESDHQVLKFYESDDPKIIKTSAPFAKTIFEPSPLNRVLEQGESGEAWQPQAGAVSRTTKFEYRVNNLEDKVLRWKKTESGFSASSFYASGDLRVEVTIDPQQNRSSTYFDKRNQKILEQRMDTSGTVLNTYYVYDLRGNLTLVVPPIVSGQLDLTKTDSENPANLDSPKLENFCFQYSYDNRNRLITKSLPGVEPFFLVYDKWDRIVLRQDGNQRVNGKWTFMKYDSFNRVVIEGEIQFSETQSQLKEMVQDFYGTSPQETRFEENGELHGYTNRSFPILGATEDVDQVWYFDDYSFVDSFPEPELFSFESHFGDERLVTAKGMTTGSKARVRPGNEFRISVSFFDQHYNQIQILTLDHMHGFNRVERQYNFSHQVIQEIDSYVLGTESTSVRETNTYDHANRLIRVDFSINESDPVTLARYEYNELGQLTCTKLHMTSDEQEFAQTVNRRFNVHGRLTSINNLPLASDQLFGLELTYENTNPEIANIPRFDGNVSSVSWMNAHFNEQQAYSYEYDGFDRLVNARYFSNAGNNSAYDVFGQDESGIAYDQNGNIKSINRNALVNGNPVTIDQLTYEYANNQLKRVVDSSQNSDGFLDSGLESVQYSYDANGNLILDQNLGFSIEYYRNNAVAKVVHDNGTQLLFEYDLTGNKLSQSLFSNQGTQIQRVDYIGRHLLVDKSSQIVFHSEGCLLKASGSEWTFCYFLTDHLGSVRVVFEVKDSNSQSTKILQVDDFYPFGRTIEENHFHEQQPLLFRLYSSKELIQSSELEWYDFGARMFDVRTCRWMTPDSLADKYVSVSPYSFVANNPIKYRELDGNGFCLAWNDNCESFASIGWNWVRETVTDGVLYVTSLGTSSEERKSNYLKMTSNPEKYGKVRSTPILTLTDSIVQSTPAASTATWLIFAGGFTPSALPYQGNWRFVRLSESTIAELNLVDDVISADLVMAGRTAGGKGHLHAAIQESGKNALVLDNWLAARGLKWSQRWQDVFNRALYERTANHSRPVHIMAGGPYTAGEVAAAEAGAGNSGITNIPFWPK